uniref:F-box domain-containing protein n=1 Tax=Oryza meridionalis TaxID=40149 RepID=A0A0E0EQS5_9ORYZ
MHLLIELVESVLLRLDSSVSLIRAASTCKPWRRLVTDAGFLRRFRGLHEPTVAGYYFDSRAESPFATLTMGRQDAALCFRPSPSAAALAIDAGSFSLAFLGDDDVLPSRWSSSWSVADSLVLLINLAAGHAPFCFPEVVVCEPLTRRHRRILPSPDFGTGCFFYGCYLADGEAAGDSSSIVMSNFRVVYELYRDDGGAGLARAAVFAAGATGAHSWRETSIGHAIPPFHRMSLMGRAGGSWYFHEGSTMAVLDGSTAEFSSSPFTLQQQPIHPGVYLYIAEGRDGEPHMFTTTGGILTVLARARRPVVAGDGEDEDEEWAVEKSVRLSAATRGLPGYDASFFGGGGPMDVITRGAGFVVLSPRIRTTAKEEAAAPARWWFAVDLETAEVERVHDDLGTIQFPCQLPWPPNFRACPALNG